ncbi:MAG: polysaccharide deacetylase family protein [Oscillospiraceae bacterium]|nr:polysaccharide deacetylase family protein [Oscillospiraceae bacterium]
MKIRYLCSILFSGILLGSGILPAFPAAGQTDSKLIALTFDDGPNTYTTPKVLDLLEEYDAHASFFLIGDKISEESAAAARRAYEMGCEINSHSRTHSNMTELTPEEIKAEMEYTEELIISITGERPKFFRPPYLSVNQTMYDTIDLPFITGYSSGDSNQEKTAQDVADAVLSAAKDGAIILMHDFYGNDKTVEALKTILPTLASEGYEFVTLTELFERTERTPEHGTCYMEVRRHPCKEYTAAQQLYTGSASGDKDWEGWNKEILLDGAMLDSLNDPFTIEVEYESEQPPVIVLHQWKSKEEGFWIPVKPAYYDTKKACFLSEDLHAVAEEYGVPYSDMTRIMVRTFITEMTITKVTLLQKPLSTATLPGDVNLDGLLDVTDAIALQKWLLGQKIHLESSENADICKDGKINAFDLAMLKKTLIGGNEE